MSKTKRIKVLEEFIRLEKLEENIQERIRAVAYFGKLTTEAAMYWCEKQKYRPIEVYPINITVAVYEARERYFKKCNFIEIIS